MGSSQNPSLPVLLVGISGPSSSGKTTLSRLLRDIFPQTSILHLDDFYLTDAEIPVKDGIQDWDCVESLNLPALKDALTYIKSNGKLPPSLVSKEDQNSVGEHGVAPDIIERVKPLVQKLIDRVGWQAPIVIVDGFLLFSNDMVEIRELFNMRLFLRTSYETAKRRREARTGYVTLEGFWEDPPGYVDKIVWPNYVKDHAFLFQGGDVEGEVDRRLCAKLDIRDMPRDAEESMTKCLQWAVGLVQEGIQRAARGERGPANLWQIPEYSFPESDFAFVPQQHLHLWKDRAYPT